MLIWYRWYKYVFFHYVQYKYINGVCECVLQVESEFLPLYSNYGIGLTTWSPLGSGVLTGKYKKGVIPPDSRFALENYKVMNFLQPFCCFFWKWVSVFFFTVCLMITFFNLKWIGLRHWICCHWYCGLYFVFLIVVTVWYITYNLN
jgi:hypothetical protein